MGVFILLVLALNNTTSKNNISKQEYKNIINIIISVIIHLINIPIIHNGETGIGLIKQFDLIMGLGSSLFQRLPDNT
jgi:hypothetical protein